VLREYFGKTLQPKRITIDFAVQEKPLGTADAVAAAESFAGGDHFLCINSDNYYPLEALEGLRVMDTAGLAGFDRDGMLRGSNIPSDRIVKFAAIVVGSGGFMRRILEKPSPEQLAELPEPICLSMNCWRFGPEIFRACRSIEPSVRGELEIPDAAQYAIDRLGVRFRVVPVNAPVLDLSSRTDVAAVKEKLAGLEVRF